MEKILLSARGRFGLSFLLLALWALVAAFGLWLISLLFGFKALHPLHYVWVVLVSLAVGAVVLWRTRTSARETFELARTMAQASHDGIVITDRKNRIVYVNDTVVESSGYSLPEILGGTPADFESGIHDQEFYRRMWRTILEEGHWRGEIWGRRKNGDLLPKDLTIRTVNDKRGRIRYHLGIHQDLTELKSLEKEKKHLLYIHQDTGLPNERALRERMEELSEKDIPFQILLTKITNKPAVIAERGEAAYLGMFERLAGRLEESHPEAEYAQIDTEFFAVLTFKRLEDVSRESFLAAHQATLAAAAATLGFPLDFCSSLAQSPRHAQNADDLLTAALVALEAANEQGEEVRVYDPSLQTTLEKSQRLRLELATAIEKEDFQVVYQPIVDSRTKDVKGYEALVRFQGYTPADFIPVAEKHGLTGAIGTIVRKQAFAAKRSLDGSRSVRPFLSLNISVLELEDDSFLEEILTESRKQGIAPDEVLLEITETAYIENYAP